MPELKTDILLFRPKQIAYYRLSGDRKLSRDRELLREDNGWTPFVRNVTTVVVPGDHDNMVLEPNVRVLVNDIQQALAADEPPPTDQAHAAA